LKGEELQLLHKDIISSIQMVKKKKDG
jgi:hypothetical protein